MRQNSLLLPCVLLAVALLLVLTYHMLFEHDEQVHAFLIVLLMTMLPLAYVDARISSCDNPMAVFHQFGLKVVVMHAAFLILRSFIMALSSTILDVFNGKLNMVGSVVVCVAIVTGFHKQLPSFHRNFDVPVLIVLAMLTACITMFLSGSHVSDAGHMDYVGLSSSAADYIEVVSFVPAALVIFKSDKKDTKAADVDDHEYKRNALAFGVFVIGFYLVEDMVTACLTLRSEPFEALAHILHFLLLLDLGVFVIASAYDPDNRARGTMMSRFGNTLFSDNV